MAVGDRRVRRTRKALHDALLALMVEKSFDAITVQEIIDRADVGRATFYSHFSDKRDLLDSGFTDLDRLLAETTTSKVRGRRGILRFSRALFQHTHEHQQLARAVVARRGASPVQDRLHEVLQRAVRADLTDLVARQGGPVPVDELTVRYVSGAFVTVIATWLETAPQKNPDEVDIWFHTLVEPGLLAALQLNGPMTYP